MYRTAPVRGAPDTIAVCRECGATSSVVRGGPEDTFKCTRCDAEQLVLRAADDLDVHAITLARHEATDAYEQLVPLLESFGVKGKASQVALACDGIRVLVSLSLSSGTVVGLDMAAPAPGLPDLKLLRENLVHRDGKTNGLIHEAQTGDDAFDERVFIESELRDADLQSVLAAPAVRAAALKLLDVTEVIRMRDGEVSLTIPKSDEPFDPATIRTRAGWLRVLAGATRPIVAENVPVPTRTRIAKRLTYLFAPVGLTVGIAGGAGFGPTSGRPYVIGAALGIVLSFLIHPFFRRALAGRSTSHMDILGARFASLFFLPFFTTGALFFYNGAMDRSPEQLVVMKIVSSEIDSDDASKIQVETVDDKGERHSYTFSAKRPPASARVFVKWRSGALGWTWASGDASLVVGGSP
jgi:hypothetical protein